MTFVDEDGNEVVLESDDARALFIATRNLDNATVSACPECRSRVVSAVAFVDVMDDACILARSGELLDFADEAPTLHLYIVDDESECEHEQWRDPLFDEWFEVVAASGPHALA